MCFYEKTWWGIEKAKGTTTCVRKQKFKFEDY